MKNLGYDYYLTLLRRVPAPIVLAVSPRAIVRANPAECLCGWFGREIVARRWYNRVLGRSDRRSSYAYRSRENCAKKFGGTYDDWDNVFRGIVWHEETVMGAWRARVQECAA